MSDILIFRDHTILDADSLANLYASDEIASILDAIPGQKVVVQHVRDKEVRRLHTDDGSTKLVDWQLLIEQTSLQVVDLESEHELNTAVNVAFPSNGKMGDDVALSAAIASHRQWTFVTDDKDSIVLLRQHQPQLHIVTTPDLLKYWASVDTPSDDVVREVLEKMKRRARYKPSIGHHLEQW